MYLSNDILVNCIQKGLRSNWLSDSAKNIAKNQKELTIRKRNWINSFNSSLSIPIPISIRFIQFLCNSNSWNWNWYQFRFQFRNWPQPWWGCTLGQDLSRFHSWETWLVKWTPNELINYFDRLSPLTAVFDTAQILAHLVHNMSRSQLYLGFGHFGWLPSFFGQ